MIFVSIPDTPEPGCDGALVGTGKGGASPLYDILESEGNRPVLITWDVEEASKSVVGKPTHPAAATIATHTTTSARILLFM